MDKTYGRKVTDDRAQNNKYMKKYSISLLVREMEIQTIQMLEHLQSKESLIHCCLESELIQLLGEENTDI